MAIDVNNIKTQFKSILDTANTTTADYDLSTGMTNRVQKVLKVNPSRIPIQPSFFPYVTIFPTDKPITLQTIAKDQITARRSTNFSFTVVGAVWEMLVASDVTDEADEQIEKLMENVEEILRRNYKLNNAVLWTKPLNTSYHTLRVDEETIMRAGAFNFESRIDY